MQGHVFPVLATVYNYVEYRDLLRGLQVCRRLRQDLPRSVKQITATHMTQDGLIYLARTFRALEELTIVQEPPEPVGPPAKAGGSRGDADRTADAAFWQSCRLDFSKVKFVYLNRLAIKHSPLQTMSFNTNNTPWLTHLSIADTCLQHPFPDVLKLNCRHLRRLRLISIGLKHSAGFTKSLEACKNLETIDIADIVLSQGRFRRDPKLHLPSCKQLRMRHFFGLFSCCCIDRIQPNAPGLRGLELSSVCNLKAIDLQPRSGPPVLVDISNSDSHYRYPDNLLCHPRVGRARVLNGSAKVRGPLPPGCQQPGSADPDGELKAWRPAGWTEALHDYNRGCFDDELLDFGQPGINFDDVELFDFKRPVINFDDVDIVDMGRHNLAAHGGGKEGQATKRDSRRLAQEEEQRHGNDNEEGDHGAHVIDHGGEEQESDDDGNSNSEEDADASEEEEDASEEEGASEGEEEFGDLLSPPGPEPRRALFPTFERIVVRPQPAPGGSYGGLPPSSQRAAVPTEPLAAHSGWPAGGSAMPGLAGGSMLPQGPRQPTQGRVVPPPHVGFTRPQAHPLQMRRTSGGAGSATAAFRSITAGPTAGRVQGSGMGGPALPSGRTLQQQQQLKPPYVTSGAHRPQPQAATAGACPARPQQQLILSQAARTVPPQPLVGSKRGLQLPEGQQSGGDAERRAQQRPRVEDSLARFEGPPRASDALTTGEQQQVKRTSGQLYLERQHKQEHRNDNLNIASDAEGAGGRLQSAHTCPLPHHRAAITGPGGGAHPARSATEAITCAMAGMVGMMSAFAAASSNMLAGLMAVQQSCQELTDPSSDAAAAADDLGGLAGLLEPDRAGLPQALQQAMVQGQQAMAQAQQAMAQAQHMMEHIATRGTVGRDGRGTWRI